MIPIFTNLGTMLSVARWRLTEKLVLVLRKTGQQMVDKSYCIVPAICQECFDKRTGCTACNWTFEP